MVVVGGKTSANTKHLADLSESHGARAYHIEGPDELQARVVRRVSKLPVSCRARRRPGGSSIRSRHEWRSWPSLLNVPPLAERFESALEERITGYRGSQEISDRLLRHFGYARDGPARRASGLRPQMVMRVATGEGAPVEHALDAAVAVEIFHNYSLVHDDIEDRDELRHGRPTLVERIRRRARDQRRRRDVRAQLSESGACRRVSRCRRVLADAHAPARSARRDVRGTVARHELRDPSAP